MNTKLNKRYHCYGRFSQGNLGSINNALTQCFLFLRYIEIFEKTKLSIRRYCMANIK
jgi:hypothetical protein